MMLALSPFVKAEQVRVVDQAQRKPAGEHARAAIGHGGQPQTVTGIMDRFTPRFSKIWMVNQQATPIATSRLKASPSPKDDHQPPQYQETQDQQQSRAGQEPEIFARHRGHEAGLLERDEPPRV